MHIVGSEKKQATELLATLPDESTLEDIQYHLYVLEKVRHGQQQIADGKSISHEEALKRLSPWL